MRRTSALGYWRPDTHFARHMENGYDAEGEFFDPGTHCWFGIVCGGHHQLQCRMMSEMPQEMARMTDQMWRRALSRGDSTKMSEQMSRVAKMLIHIRSGGTAGPYARTAARTDGPDACGDGRNGRQFADGTKLSSAVFRDPS